MRVFRHINLPIRESQRTVSFSAGDRFLLLQVIELKDNFVTVEVFH
jgi:hypothetical protein